MSDDVEIGVLIDLLEAAKEQGAERVALYNFYGDKITSPVACIEMKVKGLMQFE